jgi:hypothetical protein
MEVDPDADLAALYVVSKDTPPHAAVSASPPANGATVIQIGYPRGVGPRRQVGVWIGSGGRYAAGRLRGKQIFDVQLTVQQGDSGSGLFTSHGLVGVIWGGGSGKSAAVGHGQVQTFLGVCLQRPLLPWRRKIEQSKPPVMPSVPQSPPAMPDPGLLDRIRQDLESRIAAAHAKADGVASLAGKLGDDVRAGKADVAAIAGVATKAELAKLGGAAGGLGTLATIGVATGGIGVPVILAGWGLAALLRRRSGTAGHVTSIPAAPAFRTAALAPTPPLAQVAPAAQSKTEMHYVPVAAGDAELKAWINAMDEAGRRYPGTAATLRLVQSLKDQMAAQAPRAA